MKSRLAKLFAWALLACMVLPELAMAAGGGAIAPLVIVADTRKFTGLEAWWVNLYNESHLYFTLLTCALIPTIGVLFGVLADIVMHFIGLDLKSRDLAEH